MSSLHAHANAPRRVRKGTFSCWECKRRKMRCILDPLHHGLGCNSCRRRGSKCISQEFPDDTSLSTHSTPPTTSTTPLTPLSLNSASYQSPKLQSATGKYQELSRLLHDALPSRDDTERICRASRYPSVLAHEILTVPYHTLDQNGLKTSESLLDIPGPNSHPVLMARHMLQLAIFLQHLHPHLHREIKDLSESPRAMMERLAELAISLVTTNDELLGSIEGLQCVMIESMYQANVGNLRRSWLAGRRAMAIAQLMGLNRSKHNHRAQYKALDSKTNFHPELMWLRIVFLDRNLCLMLGLSQGSLDCSMASEAALASDTPMGRLERIHCVIACRILERNESTPNDFALTRNLDAELQRAARSLPSKWWLAPILDVNSTDSQALFWDTRRLFAQVLHYNLLNQLHLPYMLHSSAGPKDEYSRITCVNASREVLSRFITLRSFNQIAYSCRTIDFLALMAAMTLLLAHLNSHSEAENLLGHQYVSDRAMIERAQENMKEVNRLNSDALSAESAELLRRLLSIEPDTADGANRVNVQEAGPETVLPDEDAVVSVHIPYFGIIKIAREGVSKEVPRQQPTATTTSPSHPAEPSGFRDTGVLTPVDAGYAHVGAPSAVSPEAEGIYAGNPAQPGVLPLSPTRTNEVAASFAPPFPILSTNSFNCQGEDPGLTAGGNDWAFQGVDMAFFDSLMNNSGYEQSEEVGWAMGGK